MALPLLPQRKMLKMVWQLNKGVLLSVMTFSACSKSVLGNGHSFGQYHDIVIKSRPWHVNQFEIVAIATPLLLTFYQGQRLRIHIRFFMS